MVVVLYVYLDESGTHDESPVIVMAGVASTITRWCEFDQQWKLLLDQWDIEFFHMADFENRQGPYVNWTPEERRDRLGKLLSLIERFVPVGVWAAVPRDVYGRVMPPALNARIDPYHVAAISSFMRMNGILRNEQRDRDVQAAYVYEELSKGKGSVLDAYSSIKATPGLAEELRMFSLAYECKRKFRPLQAADILAYEVWKDVINDLAGKPRDRRYPIRRLEQSIDIRPTLFDDDAELQLLVPVLEKVFLR